MTRSKLHTENPHILGVIIKNPVARYLCFPSLAHKYLLAICINYLRNGRYYGSTNQRPKNPLLILNPFTTPYIKRKIKMQNHRLNTIFCAQTSYIFRLHTDIRRLTTGILSEKCVVRRFRHCANVYLHKPR